MESASRETPKPATAPVPYDQMLRVIGQALEPLGIRDFDLSIDGHDFTIRAESKKRSDSLEASKKRSLGRIFRDALSKSPAEAHDLDHRHEISSPFAVLELHFGPEEIERLEQEGKAARRSAAGETSNPHKLSQLLRAIGASVMRKSVVPLRITMRNDEVAVEYRTSSGKTDLENFRSADLYGFSVHMYKRRRSSPPDGR